MFINAESYLIHPIFLHVVSLFVHISSLIFISYKFRSYYINQVYIFDTWITTRLKNRKKGINNLILLGFIVSINSSYSYLKFLALLFVFFLIVPGLARTDTNVWSINLHLLTISFYYFF